VFKIAAACLAKARRCLDCHLFAFRRPLASVPKVQRDIFTLTMFGERPGTLKRVVAYRIHVFLT
jgi:hypothetical protein